VPAPKEILELVDRFERQLEAYKSGAYNETQLRREFLDPLFKALGWDNFANSADKSRHDQMVKLVELMLELRQNRAVARTPQEQTVLDRQITAIDAQIDRLVYDLYGLTEEEIRLVEGTQNI
jgi:hypothetical protein